MRMFLLAPTDTPPEPVAALHEPLTTERLFSFLLPHASEWQSLGETLSLDDDRLDEIYINNETEETCLREMIELYMMRSDLDHSWEEIEAALQKIIISSELSSYIVYLKGNCVSYGYACKTSIFISIIIVHVHGCQDSIIITLLACTYMKLANLTVCQLTMQAYWLAKLMVSCPAWKCVEVYPHANQIIYHGNATSL